MPVFQLTEDIAFPHPSLAEDGLLAVGGDLSPQRLLLAYRNGIFPWPEGEGLPLLWASPNPRLVLFPHKLNVSKRLLRTLRSNKFSVKFDTQFDKVIQHCARVPRPGQRGTWITREIIQAFTKLHDLGVAHSVETYYAKELVGGMYGLSMGGAFFGESMFHLKPDASKIALYFLVEFMKQHDFDFLDAQVPTPHMLQWGAETMSREHYLTLLKQTLKKQTLRGPWRGLDFHPTKIYSK